MKASKTSASRPHDAAVVDMLKADPEFADAYLAAALEEAGEPGGQTALLAALRRCATSPRPKAWLQWPSVPASRAKASTVLCPPAGTRPSKPCWLYWGPSACSWP